jgi:hypothetical protein
MKRLLIVVLAYLVLVAVPHLTRADTSTAESLFTEGQAAYDRSDFTTAIARWQVAYELSRENGLLFNIAQAQRRSGDCEGARATYLLYAAGDSDPTSAQHRLADDLANELGARCGSSKKLSVPVASSPATPPLSTPPPRPKIATDAALRNTGLVTGGAGLAILASGLVLGHHARSLGDEVTAACRVGCAWDRWRNQDARGRRDARIASVLDGLGVAAIVGGAATYYLGIHRGSLTVAPRVREGGAVVSWSGYLP